MDVRQDPSFDLLAAAAASGLRPASAWPEGPYTASDLDFSRYT